MTIDALYDRTIEVYRSARTSDGQGGWVESPELIAVARARVRPLSMRELAMGGFAASDSVVRIYTGGSIDVKLGDRITVNPMLLDHRVIGVRNPQLQGHHLEVDAQEVH